MPIIERNFFRLLRAGAYGQEEQIEPMSAWKWQQVLLHAQRLGLVPLLHDGIVACRGQFFMRLTDEQQQQWEQDTRKAERRYQQASADVAALLALLGEQQLRPILLEPWTSSCLYPTPSHRRTGMVNIFFPFATQGRKADDWARANGTDADSPNKHTLHYRWQSIGVEHCHRMMTLSNKLNNMTLHGIMEKEWLEGGTSHVNIAHQRIETVAPTLTMLISLLGIFKTTLREGLPLWQLIDLGQQLRQQGDRVDFVKLQTWMERLHFTRMAQLAGTVLTSLLGFTADEVPFMQPADDESDRLANELLHVQSPSRYIRFSPGESLSSMVANITHSLENVEE